MVSQWLISMNSHKAFRHSSFLQSAEAIPLFFRTKIQIESNHYEMKLHFQTSSFSLDIT